MDPVTERLLTPGDVADRLGCQAWKVVRLCRRGVLRPSKLAGRVRVFQEEDLPAIRTALIVAGYLKDSPEHATAGSA